MSTNPLLQHLDAFLGFARSRTGDPELAADLVQECLMKALKAGHMPEDEEGVVTWFYRILRHAIIDAHAAAVRGSRPWKNWCMNCLPPWRPRMKKRCAIA